jgi:hypothetical protein
MSLPCLVGLVTKFVKCIQATIMHLGFLEALS